MTSRYWDDFEVRVRDTVRCLKMDVVPPVRRVAVFITNRCNFHCRYCRCIQQNRTMSEQTFDDMLEKFGHTPIYHITGGEPSMVSWLYDKIKMLGGHYRFHLNTNGYIMPPAECVGRLKVSLDAHEGTFSAWENIVGRAGAFERVVQNIKQAIPLSSVSITYLLSKASYRDTVQFARWAQDEFPGLYAMFFSVYKGKAPAFAWTDEAADDFFENVLPKLRAELNTESKALLDETLDEKIRVIQGVRFPNNMDNPVCYLALSERVVDPDGNVHNCSHLYRDGIYDNGVVKHPECLYGCNRRLARFNEEVEEKLS